MNKLKLSMGIILFGSLWGVTECFVGSYLHEAGLPAGAIMTGVFAVGLMVMNRALYKQRGMQLGMGLVAGMLRLVNPFGGCFICAAIAIMAEGALFEVIWYRMSLDFSELKKPSMALSMGIISGYTLFVFGYIVTQVLTPVVSSAGFYLENLIVFLPQIFARGLVAAVIGGLIVPVTLVLKNVDIARVKDRLYYPTAATVTVVCWALVIANTLLSLSA